MSGGNEKRKRIRDKIEASQDRLDRESRQLDAIRPRPLSGDADQSGDWRGKAKQHPWLLLAAGAGAGLLVGALLPRRAGSKTASRALGLAAAGVELAIAFSKNARDAASEAASEGLHRLDEGTAPLRRRASDAADTASRSARTTRARLASEAVKMAARLRK